VAAIGVEGEEAGVQCLSETLTSGPWVLSRDDVEVGRHTCKEQVARGAADRMSVGHGRVQLREQALQVRG
jgi:hypothetical protein